MLKTFKIRLLPKKSQKRLMSQWLEECRLLYNSFLTERNIAWEKEKKSVNYHSQAVSLVTRKNEKEVLTQIHSQVLQNVAVRVDLAYKAFFRRIKAKEKPGFPRYKGFGRYDSFTFPQGGYSLIDDLLTLSKIGNIKAIVHRPVLGKVKSCTIRRINEKWYACFSCEIENELLPAINKSVGIDMGIENFATLSDASIVANPKFFKQESKSLAKAQRKLSKLTRGTKERAKAKKVVIKIHERISNRRNNFAHQESRRIINSYDTICIEDLSINKMLSKGHRCLNRNIADAAWSSFTQFLSYKAEYAGRKIVKVNPAYTSQACSKCGHRHKMELSNRVFLCPCCGFSSHRDLNASVNILSLGLQALDANPRSRLL